jgi:hypothetical protein
MFRTFCCEQEQLSFDCMHRLLKCTNGQIKRTLGVGNIVNIVQRKLPWAAVESLKYPIENHASVSLAATLSFFQGHLCVLQKCASLHRYHALSLCHKIRTMLQIPNRGRHFDIGCRDSLQCQGHTVALTTVRATVLSLVAPVKPYSCFFHLYFTWVWFYTRRKPNACHVLERRSRGRVNLSKLRLL